MAGSGCNAYQIRKIYAIGGALGMVNCRFFWLPIMACAAAKWLG